MLRNLEADAEQASFSCFRTAFAFEFTATGGRGIESLLDLYGQLYGFDRTPAPPVCTTPLMGSSSQPTIWRPRRDRSCT